MAQQPRMLFCPACVADRPEAEFKVELRRVEPGPQRVVRHRVCRTLIVTSLALDKPVSYSVPSSI